MNLKEMKKMKKANHILMMAALFLTGALSVGCSEVDDNDVNTPNPTADRVITVTGTVHFGGDGSTRSSLTEADGKLKKSFKEGEEMAVSYEQIGGDYAIAKATFTNVTATQATFTVDLEDPVSGLAAYYYPYSAYTTSGFNLTALYNNQKGTKADIEANWDWCTAYNVDITVDGTNVTLADATLGNDNVLLDIESVIDATEPTSPVDITDKITMLTILVKSTDPDRLYTISRSGATSSDPFWVALMPGVVTSISLTAYTNQDKYYAKTLSGLYLGSAHFHKASKLTLTAPQLGDLFYSDGTYSSTLEDDKTPIGVIAYLGNDKYTEKGTNMGTPQNLEIFNGHGLVLSLKNAASSVKWSTVNVWDLEFGENAIVTKKADLIRTTNVSGYSNTKALATKSSYTTDFATDYPAAHAAWTYAPATPAAPNGTTGWFLPSAQQWTKMMEGLGTLSSDNITYDNYFDTGYVCVNAWNAALSNADNGNYDPFDLTTWSHYWSSSEYYRSGEGTFYGANYLHVSTQGNNPEGMEFTSKYKDQEAIVRPVFAF